MLVHRRLCEIMTGTDKEPGPDETLTFACGTKRIRKDGKVRVLAACLEVGK